MKERVYKFYSNYEKEEAWLNKMAAAGWHCTDYIFGRYTFEQGKPGEYVYRIQLLEHAPTHIESEAYLEFLEEAGIEMVATHLRWIYLRKKAKDGPFELFSDKDSRITHYNRIIVMLLPIALFNLLFGLGLAGHFRPMNSLNLTAATVLAFPIISYYRRVSDLKKEGKISE